MVELTTPHTPHSCYTGIRISNLQTAKSSSNQETLKLFLKPIAGPSSSSLAQDLTHTSRSDHLSHVSLESPLKSPTVTATNYNHAASSHVAAAMTPESSTNNAVTTSNFKDLSNHCPICGIEISTDNATLNRHIDECLNKLAIKEAVDEFKHLPTESLIKRKKKVLRYRKRSGNSSINFEGTKKLTKISD